MIEILAVIGCLSGVSALIISISKKPEDVKDVALDLEDVITEVNVLKRRAIQAKEEIDATKGKIKRLEEILRNSEP